jgi:hypothetical protein
MMRRVLILNVILLAIVAVLVIQIGALWWGSDTGVDEVEARTPKNQRISVRSPVRPPAPRDLVQNIAGKDLFDATRAAAESSDQPGVATGSDTPLPPLNIELLGIRIIGGAREALVKEQAQPKPVWFRQGEQIGGHTLERIAPREIVVRAPNGDEMNFPINVQFTRDTSVAAPGPAGVARTPEPPTRGAGVQRTPAPGRRTPSADIKEKIERLREEARRRRAERARR